MNTCCDCPHCGKGLTITTEMVGLSVGKTPEQHSLANVLEAMVGSAYEPTADEMLASIQVLLSNAKES